jgi:superfamily II DNA/RNA helicase
MTPTAFASLPLSPETLENLQQLGYLEMTPIQAAALPPALAGQEIPASFYSGLFTKGVAGRGHCVVFLKPYQKQD